MTNAGGLEELKKKYDKKDMLGLVEAFPGHMADAWERGQSFAAALKCSRMSQVVVCGMGGSAIGGDMVRSYLGDGLRVPLHVNRNYPLPASYHEDTLFVFSSYSGNTGETLSAYNAVRGRKVPAIAITSGGRLAALCQEDGVPVCRIPGGMPPRSAIAYSFFPLLQVLKAVGLAEFNAGDFDEARSALETLCRNFALGSDKNQAAELASRIHGKLPFIYSCGGLLGAVATRWSCQFNENGKTLAHHATFPELNHNEIVGWKALEAMRSNFFVVSLEDRDDHPMAKRQAKIALEVIRPLCGGVERIGPLSGGRMSRILSTMILGDFISVYLGYLNGEDPTPVSNIDYLKERL
jgi:glucose/mannose-6-phosphate isomerase